MSLQDTSKSLIDIDLLKTISGNQWKTFGTKVRHGINTPLFSLHTAKSCGIGEFPDLIPLFPWMKSIGFEVLQLLPLNDTGMDSSPYNALSSCALNPIHLGLESLKGEKENPSLFDELKELKKLKVKPFVDYAQVRKAKMQWLKKYYQVMKSKIDYKFPFKDNSWIKSYALFKALKEKNNWKSWTEWPENERPKNKTEFDQLYSKYKEEADFHIFVQFLCMQQMEQVKQEANKNNILIQGDIPILISPDSADVWHEPHLFRLDLSAGAPPDMYSKEGQYWGFPIFNWDAIEKEGFRWWIQRLKYAEKFYHLYRIDHIVGFYRIWAVPRGRKALEGKFEPEDKKQWIPMGEKLLTMMIQNCSMLPIGEDLGVIPPEVRQSMLKLGICGTKVVRWERYWDEQDKPFIPINEYNPVSMTTVSVHDSEPLNLWWDNSPEEAKEYAKTQGWEYSAPLPLPYYQKMLLDSHRTSSLLHVNLLQEYLAQFPELHGTSPEEERINIPGTISDRNWSCRYKPSVEEIIEHEPLKRLLQSFSQ